MTVWNYHWWTAETRHISLATMLTAFFCYDMYPLTIKASSNVWFCSYWDFNLHNTMALIYQQIQEKVCMPLMKLPQHIPATSLHSYLPLFTLSHFSDHSGGFHAVIKEISHWDLCWLALQIKDHHPPPPIIGFRHPIAATKLHNPLNSLCSLNTVVCQPFSCPSWVRHCLF